VVQRLPAPRPTVATLRGDGDDAGDAAVMESQLDQLGVNLLWVVAPICAIIVFILLLALVLVVAIR